MYNTVQTSTIEAQTDEIAKYFSESHHSYFYEGRYNFDDFRKPSFGTELISGTGKPYIQLLSEFEEFLLSRKYKKLIDNKTSAARLKDSIIDKRELYDNLSYALKSYSPPEMEDLEDIKSGKALLRTNKENGIIYTVKKSDDWYIFKPYWAFETDVSIINKKTGKYETKQEMRTRLQSQWCIKKIPDILSFENIKIGVTTVEDIRRLDPSFRFFEEKNTGISIHSFSDKEGSRIVIMYEKLKDDKFYVKDIKWVQEGYNVFPYLLPIDLKLVT